MPIVCVNRPNRTRKRTWGPPGLTRIVAKVCESHGGDAVEEAVSEGLDLGCEDYESRCLRMAAVVLGTIVGTAAIMRLMDLMGSFVEIRFVSFIMNRTALGRAIKAALAAVNVTIPSFLSKAAQIDDLEIILRTFIRTNGRIFLEPPGPPGRP